MPRRRVAFLLATIAALAGAPSVVSAAAPNELSQASVAPASGDSGTPFVVSVRYHSTAGNAATTVTASAGGQDFVLTLVSGTVTDGIWSGTVLLPQGSWDVTIEAAVVNGPTASAAAR